MDSNRAAYVNMNTCLIMNVEDIKVVPVSPKRSLNEQARAMAALKDSKVLLILTGVLEEKGSDFL